MSTTSTSRPTRRNASASVRTVVGLPVPPFWERTVMVCAVGSIAMVGFIVWRSFPRRAPEPSRPRRQGGIPLQASRGLYDPSYEHDACGVAFVARVRSPASHEVVERALHHLRSTDHRRARA